MADQRVWWDVGDGSSAPEIVDLVDTADRVVLDQPARRLGLLIGLLALFVCAAFVGRLSDAPKGSGSTPAAAVSPSPSRSPDTTPRDLFELEIPAEADHIRGGFVHARGVATGAPSKLHLSVVLGEAVLGWTNVEADASGQVDVDVPVFAPLVSTPVELRVSGRDATSGGPLAIRSLFVEASGPVTLWRVAVLGAPAGALLVVDGYASATMTRLEATVHDGQDQIVATGTIGNGNEPWRPGSAGGILLGLGSFHAVLQLPASAVGARLRLDVSWTDPATGTSGVASTMLSESGGSSRY